MISKSIITLVSKNASLTVWDGYWYMLDPMTCETTSKNWLHKSIPDKMARETPFHWKPPQCQKNN